MFDVKFSDIKFDLHTVDKVVQLARDMWFGIPKWLRNILIITLVAGGLYFLWNRVIISYDMESLLNEVIELNEICHSSVVYDRYSYDIDNVVLSFKTMEEQIGTLYDEDDFMINVIESYIRKNSPSEPLLNDIELFKKRRKLTRESYEKVIKHQIDIYENIDWLKELNKP